jgi:uncharacterized protein
LEIDMYVLFLLILIAAGVVVMSHGLSGRRWWEAGVGILLLAIGPVLLSILNIWGELLWFRSLDFSSRFWTALAARLGLTAGGAIAGSAVAWLLVRGIPRDRVLARLVPALLGAVIGGLWGAANWTTVLKFWYRVPAGTTDPIFERDISFFLFTLPLLEGLAGLLLLLAFVSLAGALAPFVRWRRVPAATGSDALSAAVDTGAEGLGDRLRGVLIAGGALTLALSGRAYLAAFGLMYSRFGAVYGPGWTDVYVRLPGYYLLAAVLALAGATLILGALVGDAARISRRRLWILGSPVLASLGVWLMGLVLLPGLFQWLHVQPNEITVEKPFIEHNIRLTRQAFKLDDVETRAFPVESEFTESLVEANRATLSEVRLWDPRALNAVYEQFQEIRLYYEFADVDVDRYTIDGQYRAVMISAREMAAIRNLPRRNRTFVNLRFKYTHGYGLTMVPVSEFTPEGLPNMLVKDIPPRSASEDLSVRRPEIYYGELTDTHVLVNTAEKEFNYPSGQENVYAHYSGNGGVVLSSFLRKLAFGWKFDGTRLVVSRYLTPESRILFHRQVHDRVRTLAPFLHFDDDAYIVLDQGNSTGSWMPIPPRQPIRTASRIFPGRRRPMTARTAR